MIKIKITSWILAVLYGACGVLFFVNIPVFQGIYSDFGAPLPFPTRAVFFPGAYGWLILFLSTGVFILFKDQRFPGRSFNFILTALLFLIVGLSFLALFFPIFYLHIGPVTEQ